MTESAKLTASDAAAHDNFGFPVSLSGDTALLGAFVSDDNSGSAYVFEKQGTAWVETAKLTAFDAAADDNFGNSVSLSDNRVLVGAPSDDDAGAESGSAYVFTTFVPCLTAPTPGTVAVVNTVAISSAIPGGLVALGFSLTAGSTPVGGGCPGLTLGLGNPTLVGLTFADGSGSASFSGLLPASLSGTTIYLQAVDIPACEVTNLVSYTFP